MRAARAADAKQAHDVRVLAVGDLIAVTDYFVIASGATDRQVKALAESVEHDLRAAKRRPIRREGQRDLRWVLLDFGDVVVHLFHQEERDYYELERLWKDAPEVGWLPASRARGSEA